MPSSGCIIGIHSFVSTAADHDVPVASSMDALNGRDHRTAASHRGYIGADGVHLSDKDAEHVAEALHQTGYG